MPCVYMDASGLCISTTCLWQQMWGVCTDVCEFQDFSLRAVRRDRAVWPTWEVMVLCGLRWFLYMLFMQMKVHVSIIFGTHMWQLNLHVCRLKYVCKCIYIHTYVYMHMYMYLYIWEMHILQSLCALYWSKLTYTRTFVPIFAYIQFEILRTQQKRYVQMICIHTYNLKVMHHFDVCMLHTCICIYTQERYSHACMMHVLALLLSTFHADIHSIYMYVCKYVYIYIYIHMQTSYIHKCWALRVLVPHLRDFIGLNVTCVVTGWDYIHQHIYSLAKLFTKFLA